MLVIALLYDVHGNLAALEAVLAEAERQADELLLGGDYVGFGPWPRETLERLDRIATPATWIRGNGERWFKERPADRPEVEPISRVAEEAIGDDAVERLYALPVSYRRGETLFVHGSPLSDVESFAAEPRDDDELLLAGEHEARTIVFGHSHLQFVREGPGGVRLVNPGSVGQPLDGDRRAAWALMDGDRIELRRTEYDVERAIEEVRRVLPERAVAIVEHRLRYGRD
jgi:putative phosphoesterase